MEQTKKCQNNKNKKKYVWNYQSNQIYYYILLIVYTQFKFQKTKGKALEFMGEQYKKKWHTKTYTPHEKNEKNIFERNTCPYCSELLQSYKLVSIDSINE